MKALYYIFGLALLTLVSCTSKLYVGTEYDDLYYVSSDQPVYAVETRGQIVESNLQSGEYYDNIYANDTLIADEYRNASDYNNPDAYSREYDYYDNYSYSGRLRNFYGNYFYPYWRDPFYYSWYPFGYYYGYRAFPYYYGYYDPFFYDSYFYDPFYYRYGGFYNSYYFGYYPGFYTGFYSSYYYPYYSRYAYYPGIYFDERLSVPYGRRERASTLSSRWSGGTSVGESGISSDRRSGTISTATDASTRRSGVTGTQQDVASGSRRIVDSGVNTRQATNPTDKSIPQDPAAKSSVENSRRSVSESTSGMKPEYNSVNRTYTPSYNDPRLSTRPSYNNSRVNTDINQGTINRTNTEVNTRRTEINRNVYQNRSSVSTSPSVSGVRSRSSSSSGSGTYSIPARRSSESSFSSGSYNSGSRSSFSSGSSSSGSVGRSSYSSGSSSGSSSSSSSSRSSSGTRR